ncbi:unnamed protein product [Medioppia subpectinata]|uniref:ENTH domain-containing protein n=1 Tax=Medioppia subpectinata TaxID=1979941 RepID=A0A7R9KCX2_9ACAR|nr:unnamed protein product [Medioppia subpectinata]CAG2101186.1 unnamed protein product [Medioppia subpectinata]
MSSMAAHSGQTLNDRLNAARYALAGQGLARVVCKATTEEVSGPKKKHLDYLLQCTHEPNVSIPQLANLLIERTNHSSWVVVFKALVTVHHLMCYGNERFTQYLASSNCTFQLSNFLDKTGVKGYEMSTFIRRYAKYLNEKAFSYRTVAFDFTKVKRGKEDGSLRTMNTDKLIKTVPTLQSQVDTLLEFDCNANDLTNGVINAGFMLLFRDLIRLFACYNDAIINCLEKFFDMNKKQAREALDIYKKFLIRMDKVCEFLKVAENVGIDKGEIPDLTKAPSSLLDALEQHLAQLEGKKGQSASNTSQPTNGTSSSNGAIASDSFNGAVKEDTLNVGIDKGEIPDLTKAPSSLLDALEQHLAQLEGKKGQSASNTSQPTNGTSSSNGAIASDSFNGAVKEDTSVKKALEEEEQMLNRLKERHLQDKDGDKKANNPFLSMSPTAESKTSPTSESKSQGLLDFFTDSETSISTKSVNTNSGKASDDLLFLSNANPFADILNAAISNAPPPQAYPSMAPTMAQPTMVPLIQNQPFNGMPTNGNNMFASEDGFAAAFGKRDTTSASDHRTDTITITSADDPNLSTSPSPTQDIIRGAGTTPILPIPDHGFGEDSGIDESNTSRGNSPLPASAISAPPPSGENSPFAQSFEANSASFAATFGETSDGAVKTAPLRPQPPSQHDMGMASGAAPVRPPPPSGANIEHGFEMSAEFGDESTGFAPAMGGGPIIGNIPFAAFDANQQQYIIQQQLLFQQQQRAMSSPQMQQKPAKKASAFEDLDFAMRETMSKPQKPVGAQPQQQSTSPPSAVPPGLVYVPPGTVPPAGYIVMPGMPSYGIATGAAGFDAFGDVLQPQNMMANKMGQTVQTGPQMAPIVTPNTAVNANQSLFKGDLDSSLASLAQNLDINGPKGSFKKPGQQFSSPKNTIKTGAPIQPQTQQMAWNAGQQMGAWNAGGMPIAAQPGAVPAGGQWPAAAGVQPMNAMAYGVQMRPGMVSGMPPVGAGLPGAIQVLPNTTGQRPVNPGVANTQSDPFGAL